MEFDPETIVTLEAFDEETPIKLPINIALQMEYVKDILQVTGCDEPHIKLEEIEYKTLKKVIEYCEYYSNNPRPPAYDAMDKPLTFVEEDFGEGQIEGDTSPIDPWHVSAIVMYQENVKPCEWDTEYFSIYGYENRMELFKIQNAANILQHKQLFLIASLVIAKWIEAQNYTIEQLRDYFYRENDLTEEEEEALREKYKWAFENDEDTF